MMKHSTRKYTAYTVMILFLVSSLSCSFSFAAERAGSISVQNNSGATVVIDGEETEFSTQPVIINGTTFVPMREVFESLDAEVTWNGDRKEVYAEKSDTNIVLKIGSKTAFKDNQVLSLLEKPYISDGRTMIPLRFVSEAFGYSVNWDGVSRTVTISSIEGSSATGSEADSDSPILTYSDAIKQALKVSPDYKNAKLAYDSADRTFEEYEWLFGSSNALSTWKTRKSLRMQQTWTEKNIQLTEEQIGYQVISCMDQINLKKKEIDRKQEYIEYLNQKAETAKLKYDLGALSKKDYLSAVSSSQAAEDELYSLNLSLDELYLSLNSLLQNSAESREDLEVRDDFESVEGLDIESLIREKQADDPYIWLIEQQEELADYSLKTYEYNVGGQSYKLTLLDLYKAENNTEAVKQKFQKVMRNRYNSLLKIESQIQQLNTSLDTLNENLDTVRTLYDVGRTTKDQLQELLEKKSDLIYNIQALQASHQLTRMQLDKPYLVPEYAQG